MGKKERVILIKGDSSNWYEQAIFIVNQNTPPENMPVDFVSEAEKIIHNYINKTRHNAYQKSQKPKNPNVYTAAASTSPAKPAAKQKPKRKVKRFDFILNTVMALGCVAIAAILLFGILA